MKTKKYRRNDKNNLLSSRVLLRATVKWHIKKVELKIHRLSRTKKWPTARRISTKKRFTIDDVDSAELFITEGAP
ncbi:hypothetical protein [Vibrio sagamiensis]|uniref:Uncharacterized protein n=1 Tax=Vibrio sagamiensis NBRC 104589 TaxID=1219064 RepID=A0A511QDI1_9VIBR|nr:hypothetical protein [Vibrio sagamiensis]GEM75246.1 hypothetical protein VSA01S_13580 [Vibrio sagamiensis NBRC 104589]